MLDALLAGGVILLVIGILAATRYSTEVVLMAGLTILLVAGVLTPEQALVGFANPGLATVAVLYVVVAGMRETGSVAWVTGSLLGRPVSLAGAYTRMILPVAFMSAFVNNTPIVAMMIPAVRDWARRTGFAASKLLMPLSFAAMVGGTCTIIGTSTNLVLNEMLVSATGSGLGFFDLAIIGVPCTLLVFVFMLVVGQRWLPERVDRAIDADAVKQYLIEMQVEAGSSLAGKSVQEAGLRHLPGLYLMDIERKGMTIPAVAPEEKLAEGDVLVFTGMVDSVADLRRFDGLRLASDHVSRLDLKRGSHSLVEVVVAEACPLVGRSIRQGNFRNVYNAAIISVSRNGEHLRAKVGDIVLQAGDMLLLEAHADFTRQYRNNKDFMLVSGVANSEAYRTEKRPLALAIFAGMILLTVMGATTLLVAGMVAAGLLMLTRCTSASNARREVSWQVLIVIGASIGLGNALVVSGAAQLVAQAVFAGLYGHPLVMLLVVFGLTALLTAVISNIAAATLMFPVVLSLANASGVSADALVVTVMVAASASFATPIGYQTNLMVYGPGGYQFTDFVKVGTPLTILVGFVTVLLAYHFF
ncbi:MAG: SLC13 family permease [Pseudomonadota bacterium]